MQTHKKFVVFIRKISLDAPPEYHAEIFFVWTPNTIYLKNNSISKKMIKNLCLEIFFNIKKTILTVTIYFSKKREENSPMVPAQPSSSSSSSPSSSSSGSSSSSKFPSSSKSSSSTPSPPVSSSISEAR